MKKQAPITAEVGAVSTDFASEANSINQMHRELLGFGLSMLELEAALGLITTAAAIDLPHASTKN